MQSGRDSLHLAPVEKKDANPVENQEIMTLSDLSGHSRAVKSPKGIRKGAQVAALLHSIFFLLWCPNISFLALDSNVTLVLLENKRLAF